ncbi:DNA primase [Prevotella sp. KH2C16]|uniref:DNA primase n=1 Tax=Prevotella sp. KH2C16 TaxID=1855325 RepID=UPI0008E2E850|nr:DNA primase [Prevotella sp. KH2C16]SFG39675.1 DNA primase [Prevotella sp. KH2C16]
MIDRQTIERIKDAADIVDVVSDFVTLKRSGANYKGLCPFHNEKTPSFIVTPSRGTCHCFGCGKGGDAVSFIMEHEQMNYPEALRWLANKYHIEIQERELSPEEKKEESERESMYIVNEWAASYFEELLHNNVDGLALGMQYFRSRGFRDDTIKAFRLGYDLQDRRALARTALGKGYQEEFLLKTGICFKTDQGELLDRYAGRVVFPWVGLNGKVLGFTARVLDARTKGVSQKYVNSPSSDIFDKSNALYGIYQARKAIAKEDRVYLVEGQADVISMYQSGIHNVVAGSGTALTFPQIRMLHRFSSNITLIYDDDPAGIHAALRGTDMLLSEGMNLKVLLLPEGEDPDSFARKNTASDFRKYIEENQTDFIQFKTSLLLRGETDPLKRSEAINSIVQSIAVVQNQILRDTYLHDCAQRIGINEATLINQMNRFIRQNKEKKGSPDTRQPERIQVAQPAVQPSSIDLLSSKVEQMLVQMIICHGEEVIFKDVEDENGVAYNLTVSQYVDYDLSADGLKFQNPLFNRVLREAVEHNADEDFKAEPYFLNHPDLDISRLAADMSVRRYQLLESLKNKSAVPEAKEISEKNRIANLRNQTLHLIADFRMDYVEKHLLELKRQISESQGDGGKMLRLMKEYTDMQQIRNALAKKLGNEIIV